MPQDKVVQDVRKAAAQGDLIGWQEIGPSRYFDAIKGLGKDWGHYMPKDGNLRILPTLEGYDTLRRLASTPDAIVPGHDPLVLARHPPAGPGLEGIAVRLDG